MSLVSDLIQLAYEDLAVVQPGETITAAGALQTTGFTTLNGFMGTLSMERRSAFRLVMQTFNLAGGVSAYTLGSGGSFPTTGALRAQEVTSWIASSGDMRKGGAPLSMEQFATACVDGQMKLAALYTQATMEGVTATVPAVLTAPIPSLVGVDTAFPLINIRVWPIPAAVPGSIELSYWTPLLQFATVGDTVTLPEGWFNMLRFNLAVLLYPRHARLGGLPPELAANAQNSKASLVQQNEPEAAQQ